MYLRRWIKGKAPRKCPCLSFPSPMAQPVKNLPAMQEMQETRVWALGQQAPLEEDMATYSSILAWRVPWTGEPGGLQSTGSQRVGHDWATSLHFTTSFFEMLYSQTGCRAQLSDACGVPQEAWENKEPVLSGWWVIPIHISRGLLVITG